VLAAAGFPGPEPYYSWTVGAGGLLLLVPGTVKVPLWLSSVLRTCAGTSLFVYMLHGLPVHVFRYETTWLADWGIAASTLIVLPATFLLSLFAKSIFEFFDGIVLNLVSRVRKGV
jgi:surface polysaccharide O-acyltransferase-like enzyme